MLSHRALAVLALATAVPTALAQSSWTQVDQLDPTLGLTTAPYHFGRSIALGPTRSIVGAPGIHGQPGHAFAFSIAGLVWTPHGELVPSLSLPGDDYGRACALAGDLALIGAPLSGSAGRAFLFQHQVFPGWVEIAAIDVPGMPSGAAFGRAVALDASTAIVGAPGASEVHVYAPGPSGWEHVQTLSRGYGPNQFGASLALQGDRLVVGAPVDDMAYVFERRQGVWTATTMLTPPPGIPRDQFGEAVALDGDRILVATPDDEGQAAPVHVFELGPTGWTGTGALLPAAGAPLGEFGIALGLRGDTAFVGAPVNGLGLGSAHVFQLDAGSWSEVQVIAPGQSGAKGVFASAVAVSGDTAMFNVGIDEGIPPFVVQGGYAGTVLVFASNASSIQLAGQPATLSVSSGGAQSLALDAGPAHAGKAYLALGSVTGTYPGIALGSSILPLSVDGYTLFTAQQPNQPPLAGSFGLLDSAGHASVSFAVAPGASASLIGVNAYHACVVLDLAGPQLFAGTSNPVGLALLP